MEERDNLEIGARFIKVREELKKATNEYLQIIEGIMLRLDEWKKKKDMNTENERLYTKKVRSLVLFKEELIYTWKKNFPLEE